MGVEISLYSVLLLSCVQLCGVLNIHYLGKKTKTKNRVRALDSISDTLLHLHQSAFHAYRDLVCSYIQRQRCLTQACSPFLGVSHCAIIGVSPKPVHHFWVYHIAPSSVISTLLSSAIVFFGFFVHVCSLQAKAKESPFTIHHQEHISVSWDMLLGSTNEPATPEVEAKCEVPYLPMLSSHEWRELRRQTKVW